MLRVVYLLAGKSGTRFRLHPRPFIDFLGVQILGRIAIFQRLPGKPGLKPKTKSGDHQDRLRELRLDRTMKKVFGLLLRVLNVPIELLTAVLEK